MHIPLKIISLHCETSPPPVSIADVSKTSIVNDLADKQACQTIFHYKSELYYILEIKPCGLKF